MGEQGFVYFIKTEDEQFIKIGFSKQPMNRAGKFGTLMPIRLIGYFPGSRATERWLHTKFAHAHRVGEWFENTDALREFIGMLGLIEPLPEKRRKIRVKRIRLEPETKPQLEIDGKSPKSVREYLAEIGSRGGKAKVPKGIASLTPKERKERAKQAAAARWGTKTKATKKAKKKK